MKPHPDEKWCRSNATPEESQAFWKCWCESQWGMPTFDFMRKWIEAYRLRVNAAA